MLMYAIAHCTNTVRESAQEVDSGRKIPCRTGDLNPSQYCAWLFSPTLYPLSSPGPWVTASGWLGVKSIQKQVTYSSSNYCSHCCCYWFCYDSHHYYATGTAAVSDNHTPDRGPHPQHYQAGIDHRNHGLWRHLPVLCWHFHSSNVESHIFEPAATYKGRIGSIRVRWLPTSSSCPLW